MSDEINGWKPPVIYDIHTDTHRIATQQDIDQMTAAINALIGFRGAVKRAMADADFALDRAQMIGPDIG